MTATSPAPAACQTLRWALYGSPRLQGSPAGGDQITISPIFQKGSRGSRPSVSHLSPLGSPGVGSDKPAMDEDADSRQHQKQDNADGHAANHRHVARSFRGCQGRPADDEVVPRTLNQGNAPFAPKDHFRDVCGMLLLVTLPENIHSHFIDGK